MPTIVHPALALPPDAAADIVVTAIPDDERVWVPQAERVCSARCYSTPWLASGATCSA